MLLPSNVMATEFPVGTGLVTLLRTTAVTSAKLELVLPVLGARVTSNAVVVGACDDRQLCQHCIAFKH